MPIKIQTETQRQAELDRLLVLAIKHCPRDHHDWEELMRLAKQIEE